MHYEPDLTGCKVVLEQHLIRGGSISPSKLHEWRRDTIRQQQGVRERGWEERNIVRN